jgi:hypothetical protein
MAAPKAARLGGEPTADVTTGPAAAGSAPAPVTAGTDMSSVLLGLQASAGNQAVAQILRQRMVIQRDTDDGGDEPTLDDRYRAALENSRQTGDWTTTAQLLNGFSRVDILNRLAKLSGDEVNYLHLGALGNPAVGPDSQVAQLTAPGAPQASTEGPEASQVPAATPGAVPPPASADLDIASMSWNDKLLEAYRRADIGAATRAKINSMLTPQALVAAIVSFAAVFVASQFTPVGWAADVAIGLSAVFIGTSLFTTAKHLIRFADAADATTSEQLDVAGKEFAQAVAEIGVDAALFIITRSAGGGGGGAASAETVASQVVLATQDGQLVVVAVETIPVQVAGAYGIVAGTTAWTMSGTPDDDDYWEDKYGDDPRDDLPRRQRISDGNKTELEDSDWLKRRLPDDDRRREFMDWLKKGHRLGEPHVHKRPSSRELEQAVQEFELENPG